MKAHPQRSQEKTMVRHSKRINMIFMWLRLEISAFVSLLGFQVQLEEGVKAGVRLFTLIQIYKLLCIGHPVKFYYAITLLLSKGQSYKTLPTTEIIHREYFWLAKNGGPLHSQAVGTVHSLNYRPFIINNVLHNRFWFVNWSIQLSNISEKLLLSMLKLCSFKSISHVHVQLWLEVLALT